MTRESYELEIVFFDMGRLSCDRIQDCPGAAGQMESWKMAVMLANRREPIDKQRRRLYEERWVAHVNHAYPVHTQTFTQREIVALRDAGVDVRVFSLRPADPNVTGDLAGEVEGTSYLPGALSVASLLANLRQAVRHPVSYLGWLCACLLSPYPAEVSLPRRGQSVAQFLRAAALAEAIARQGGRAHIHAQFADGAATTAAVAAEWLRAPFSFASHTSYNSQLLARKLCQAILVTSISEFDRDRLVAAEASAADRIHIVHCGIPLEEWPARAGEGDPGQILSVGSLIDKKGHDVLLEACSKLRERGVEHHLTVVGTGQLKEGLLEMRSQLGLDEHVTFTGSLPQEEVRPLLKRARVFVLACVETATGDIDGIPVSLMEAMATGVPVVSTRLSGIPELIEDGRCGLLVEPGDASALASALEALLADPERCRKLGAAGRARLVDDFDASVQGRRLAELLRALDGV